MNHYMDRGGIIQGRSSEHDPRVRVMKRIEGRLDPTKALEGEEEMSRLWTARASLSPTQENYEKSLAVQWRETDCAGGGATFVLHALLRRLGFTEISPFAKDSPEVPKLAAAFLDTEHCPGARGLTEAEIAKLKEIAAKATQPAPKP
jgi:hypothetical protein